MQFTPFYIPTLQQRKRVYLSGPMTGFPENNAVAFGKAAKHLRRLDYAVCNPVETSAILGDHLSHQEYLRFDFERILEADFLVALEGWEKSVGARAEILMAIRMGIKVWRWETWGSFDPVTENDVVESIAKQFVPEGIISAEPHYPIGGTDDDAEDHFIGRTCKCRGLGEAGR